VRRFTSGQGIAGDGGGQVGDYGGRQGVGYLGLFAEA